MFCSDCTPLVFSSGPTSSGPTASDLIGAISVWGSLPSRPLQQHPVRRIHQNHPQPTKHPECSCSPTPETTWPPQPFNTNTRSPYSEESSSRFSSSPPQPLHTFLTSCYHPQPQICRRQPPHPCMLFITVMSSLFFYIDIVSVFTME